MFGIGNGRFSKVFQPKGLSNIQKRADDEEQKLLDKNDIFTLDARERDELIVYAGGMTGSAAVLHNLNLMNYRDYINEYYLVAQNPEVDEAIDIIINEIVSVEEGDDVVSLDLDGLEMSEGIKEKIRQRWDNVLQVTKFNETAFELVKDWFISGRQGFYITVDNNNLKKGVTGALMLDPRCLRPITAVELERSRGVGKVDRIVDKERGFIYDPSLLERTQRDQNSYTYNFARQTLFIPEKSVSYVDSGERPDVWGFVPSRLHYAIKAANNLVTVEDATVIYAITRAPERRAFYLDVGTLGTNAAKSYMEDMMDSFQTEMNYDRTTGKIINNQSTMGIVEDFWLPRREGANATEIQTLDGGQNLGEMRHVLYFQQKLYKAMKIPTGRIEGGGAINIGGSDLAEVDREEHRFNKYTKRLGRKYVQLLLNILYTDLELTKTIDTETLKNIKGKIKAEFNSDSYIVERQEAETMANRISNLSQIEPYVGKVISLQSTLTKVMRMTDEEIAEERQKIADEQKQGLYGGEGENPLKRPEGGF